MTPAARSPRRPAPTAIALVLATLGALLAVATPSSAAPYTVWSCQGPNGEPLPGTAWTPATSGTGATASNDCATGVVAALPAGRGNVRAAGTLTFAAPAGTRVTSFELARTLRATVGGLFPSGYAAGVAAIDPAGPLGAGCSAGGLFPSTCTVGDPPLSASGVSIGGIVLSASCTQDSCGGATPAADAALARSRVVVEDPRAPTLAGTSGTVTDTDRVTRTITVAAADVGGGVSGISANVDGGSTVAVAGGGACAAPFVAAQPCPSSRAETFSVDTSALRRGDHVATGTIVDAAGNSTTWGPVPFTVTSDGSSDLAPAPAGATAIPVSPGTTPAGSPAPTARLTFQGSTAKNGRRVPTGYLRTAGGTPLAGVSVRLTRTQTGAENPRTIVLKAVRTSAKGRFVGLALPEGAWTVAGSAEVPGGTISGSIRLRTGLRTTAAPSPTRLRTGALMILSGRLTGAGPAKADVRVRIQAIVRGKYTTVAAVRTSKTGRWRWRHRFTKVSRPTLFAFRAVVPGEGDTWPWSPVSRRAAVVRVDPR